MPYFCHLSNHLYDPCDDCDGCSCVHTWDDYEPPKNVVYVGTVPGGHNSSDPQYKFQSEFDKGLDEYKKAKDNGLAPESTTVAGVAKAHEQVQSHSRALKKLEKHMDTSELVSAPGVER